MVTQFGAFRYRSIACSINEKPMETKKIIKNHQNKDNSEALLIEKQYSCLNSPNDLIYRL